jgi:hypothetical protein
MESNQVLWEQRSLFYSVFGPLHSYQKKDNHGMSTRSKLDKYLALTEFRLKDC